MSAHYDLIVVTSYPPEGQTHGNTTVGVASYAKNTLLALSYAKPLQILVLAEELPNSSSDYHEDNIHVVRCWRRNSFSAYLDILKHINKHKTKPVLFEFEMAMLGNPALNVFVPLFLTFLRLSGRSVTTVLHQVVLDFGEISGHIGQKKDSPLNPILSFLAKNFYRLVVALSTKVIVFEQFLKNRLDRNNPKIVIIPHGVESQNAVKSVGGEAKEANGAQSSEQSEGVSTGNSFSSHKKNDFIVTVFGFLAWYKGTDWITKVFADYFSQHPKSNIKLVIAGGPNPNHLDKPYYKDYLVKIQSNVAKYPQNISLTGFVSEADIQKYYQESDLIVLPYRVGMSSSGPLSIAFTHHKPFLVSSKIAPILLTDDIMTSLKSLHLNPLSLTFTLSPKHFWHRLLALKNHPDKLAKVATLSTKIEKSRNWSSIGQRYLQSLGL
jgi:glycosyltransferase involved in cell wall biosynthesis